MRNPRTFWSGDFLLQCGFRIEHLMVNVGQIPEIEEGSVHKPQCLKIAVLPIRGIGNGKGGAGHAVGNGDDTFSVLVAGDDQNVVFPMAGCILAGTFKAERNFRFG